MVSTYKDVRGGADFPPIEPAAGSPVVSEWFELPIPWRPIGLVAERGRWDSGVV
jgi:hypothetical protein